ncbi:MAG TPA: hypothetical protein VE979_19330 [Streptosporangiaceae bacterium]|nr:hypothetical protein [Streptosporangiaceae bacterium]
MRGGRASAALLAGVVLAAGCSSSGGSGGGSTPASSSAAPATTPATASAAVCHDVDALRTSLGQLGSLSYGPNALSKLKTDLTKVKDSLVTLRGTAGTAWRTQIDALSSALSKLQKTLGSLGSQPSATAAAKAVSTDLAAVTTAGANLLRTASIRCPEASSSPSA